MGTTTKLEHQEDGEHDVCCKKQNSKRVSSD